MQASFPTTVSINNYTAECLAGSFLVEEGCCKEEAAGCVYIGYSVSIHVLCAVHHRNPAFPLQHARLYGCMNTIASQSLYSWRRRVVWNNVSLDILCYSRSIVNCTGQVLAEAWWRHPSPTAHAVIRTFQHCKQERAFVMFEPDSWNDIPVTLRDTTSLSPSRDTSLSPSTTHHCHPPRHHITVTLRDTLLSPSTTHHCQRPRHITVTLRDTSLHVTLCDTPLSPSRDTLPWLVQSNLELIWIVGWTLIITQQLLAPVTVLTANRHAHWPIVFILTYLLHSLQSTVYNYNYSLQLQSNITDYKNYNYNKPTMYYV